VPILSVCQSVAVYLTNVDEIRFCESVGLLKAIKVLRFSSSVMFRVSCVVTLLLKIFTKVKDT
jgi:hypothetical protein